MKISSSAMRNKMPSGCKRIMSRVKRKGYGWVFTAYDFLDLASRKNLNTALCHLNKNGDTRRVSRGIYDYPETHIEMGILVPNLIGVAQAVARQTGDRITHSGATAANLLGLTTQVQGKIIYTTTGKPKKIAVRDKFITLVSSPVPNALLDWNSPVSMTLQALNNLGKKHLTKDHLEKCAQHLSITDKNRIRMHLHQIEDSWLQGIARQLTDS